MIDQLEANWFYPTVHIDYRKQTQSSPEEYFDGSLDEIHGNIAQRHRVKGHCLHNVLDAWARPPLLMNRKDGIPCFKPLT